MQWNWVSDELKNEEIIIGRNKQNHMEIVTCGLIWCDVIKPKKCRQKALKLSKNRWHQTVNVTVRNEVDVRYNKWLETLETKLH